MRFQYGGPAVSALSLHVTESVATIALLKGVRPQRRADQMPARVTADGSLWRFHASSVLTGDDILVVAPTEGTGRWIREVGAACLEMPFTFAKTDGALHLTVAAGFVILPFEFAWKVTTNFTGGSSSTIGVSSTNIAGSTTKGDLLGGAAGDLAAALTTTLSPNLGTIGTVFDTLAERRKFIKGGDTIRHDRITSAFTTGVGALLLACQIVKNPLAA